MPSHVQDLNSLEWVGFDMDYTLSSYKPALGTLIYELAKEHLVSAKQYPPSLSSLRYDPDFAVRGVAFDTRRGNLLKLDFLHTVSAAFFGRRELSRAEVVAAYGSLVVKGAELAAFRPMVDLFCLPEACLISDVIQQFVDRGVSFHPSYVYSDVKAAVGHLHTSGVLHDAVAASPAQYIDDCPRLVELLRGLHGAGKRTFLLTNSGFRFVAPVMSHLTRADLPPGGWLDLFDFVGVSADKPAWYLEDRPFRSLNPATGKLRWVPVEAVLPGQPYAGGSFAELNRLTGGALAGAGVFYLARRASERNKRGVREREEEMRGAEITPPPPSLPIFFCSPSQGDHVFSDLARPSRVGWRTGAIIHELEREVALQTSQPYRELLQGLQAVEHALRRGRHPEGDLVGLRAERERLREARRGGRIGAAAAPLSRSRLLPPLVPTPSPSSLP